jgi:thioredoxin-related protein
MKHVLLAVIVLAVSTAFADDLLWQTEFNTASALAEKENKPILIDFTGSSWCPPCKLMKKEVLSKKEFLDFASKNLILLEVDMLPTGEAAVPKLDNQNQYLARKFGIEGFPTFVLINSKGKEIARNFGYIPGGPKAFIDWVEKSVKK